MLYVYTYILQERCSFFYDVYGYYWLINTPEKRGVQQQQEKGMTNPNHYKVGGILFLALHQKLYLIFSEHTPFTLVRENQQVRDFGTSLCRKPYCLSSTCCGEEPYFYETYIFWKKWNIHKGYLVSYFMVYYFIQLDDSKF
ncbi:hypothetical protein [Geobacillus sp. YHL]|uniref:hypothetical protein n=1 Tax=Geobacillus sp. YHL TaxID=2796117 RepID=UPI001EEFDFF0|nr:hypothetical protein [Geobacillus sp. YHL]